MNYIQFGYLVARRWQQIDRSNGNEIANHHLFLMINSHHRCFCEWWLWRYKHSSVPLPSSWQLFLPSFKMISFCTTRPSGSFLICPKLSACWRSSITMEDLRVVRPCVEVSIWVRTRNESLGCYITPFIDLLSSRECWD